MRVADQEGQWQCRAALYNQISASRSLGHVVTSRTRRPTLARNAVANWSTFLFAAIVSFFLSPFVVHHLGATNYGVWTLLGGLVGYLGLLDIGLRNAVSRYIAHYQAAGKHAESSSIASAALKLFLMLGILAIVLSGALAFFAPRVFNIPEALVDDARVVVVLGGLSIAVGLVSGVFAGIVTGLQRFDVFACLEVFVTTVRTVAFVLSLWEGYGLVALACIQLGSSLLSLIVLWVIAHRLYPGLRLKVLGSLYPQIRTILSFSISLSVLYLFGQLIYYSGTLVIAAFLPIEAVTFFSIAGVVCFQARGVAASLSNLMAPRVSALTSMGSSRVAQDIVAVARIATLVVTPIAVVFVLRGESFITLWMGSEYGPASGGVLRILAIVLWLEASRSVVIFSLVGMGRQRTLIPGMALEAAGNLALTVALVRPFGIVGASLGTLIPSMLVGLGYIPRCLSQEAAVPASLFYRKALLQPTAACVPFALASAAIERFTPAGSLAVFLTQVIATLPMVPVGAWFLCLSTAEKQHVKLRLRDLVGGSLRW